MIDKETSEALLNAKHLDLENQRIESEAERMYTSLEHYDFDVGEWQPISTTNIKSCQPYKVDLAFTMNDSDEFEYFVDMVDNTMYIYRAA